MREKTEFCVYAYVIYFYSFHLYSNGLLAFFFFAGKLPTPHKPYDLTYSSEILHDIRFFSISLKGGYDLTYLITLQVEETWQEAESTVKEFSAVRQTHLQSVPSKSSFPLRSTYLLD